ncbi:MAG: gamma-glutamylcyclotransferase family protein [Eubacteriales bacterium]|nr:gamma-glutamylcyclotransferase family protein [Eubacteriales bacterium]
MEMLYFAYGSNMNLGQMEFRCPDAKVVQNVRLENYRLAFGGRNPNSGVATILPEKGSHVDGVMWLITGDCERRLDRYEGYPHLYGKELHDVTGKDGKSYAVMVYVMKEPYKDFPAIPSGFYLNGILEGCEQNNLSITPVMEAVYQTQKEVKARNAGKKKEGKER